MLAKLITGRAAYSPVHPHNMRLYEGPLLGREAAAVCAL